MNPTIINLKECFELFWVIIKPLLYLGIGVILTVYVLYWIGGIISNQGQQHEEHRKYIQ